MLAPREVDKMMIWTAAQIAAYEIGEGNIRKK